MFINRENKAQSCFFLKNDKVDEPLARLIRTKKIKYKLPMSRMKGDIITDPTDANQKIRDYYVTYDSTFDSSDELDKFFKK